MTPAIVTAQVTRYPRDMLPAREFTPQVRTGSNLPMRIDEIRLANARALAKIIDPQYPIKGLANALDKHSSLISQYIGKNPTKKIGDSLAREIERKRHLPDGWMDSRHHHVDTSAPTSEIREELLALRTPQVPVIGRIESFRECGLPDNPEPIGFLSWFSTDPAAYALQSLDDELSPRIRHGEFLVIEPNHPIGPGDEVIVTLNESSCLIKIFLYEKDGRSYFQDLNQQGGMVGLSTSSIRTMEYLVGPAKPDIFLPRN